MAAGGGVAADLFRLIPKIKSFAEQHCKLVSDQRAELVAGGETAIGQSVRLDAAEHLAEPGIAVWGRRLNVDELRHSAGVEVLVFQPGNLLVGAIHPYCWP